MVGRALRRALFQRLVMAWMPPPDMPVPHKHKVAQFCPAPWPNFTPPLTRNPSHPITIQHLISFTLHVLQTLSQDTDYLFPGKFRCLHGPVLLKNSCCFCYRLNFCLNLLTIRFGNRRTGSMANCIEKHARVGMARRIQNVVAWSNFTQHTLL